MRGRDLAHDVEPHPEALGLAKAGGADEGLEDPALVDLRNPDPPITHREPGVSSLSNDSHSNRLARTVLESVREEVGDELLDAEPVPEAGYGLGRRELDHGARCFCLFG